MSREFLPGQIIAYPYLWAWQQERGETEGRTQKMIVTPAKGLACPRTAGARKPIAAVGKMAPAALSSDLRSGRQGLEPDMLDLPVTSSGASYTMAGRVAL